MDGFWITLGSGEFVRIVALSLGVSLSATAAAIVVGLPLGAALAVFRFPGRRLLIVVVNALLCVMFPALAVNVKFPLPVVTVPSDKFVLFVSAMSFAPVLLR